MLGFFFLHLATLTLPGHAVGPLFSSQLALLTKYHVPHFPSHPLLVLQHCLLGHSLSKGSGPWPWKVTRNPLRKQINCFLEHTDFFCLTSCRNQEQENDQHMAKTITDWNLFSKNPRVRQEPILSSARKDLMIVQSLCEFKWQESIDCLQH